MCYYIDTDGAPISGFSLQRVVRTLGRMNLIQGVNLAGLICTNLHRSVHIKGECFERNWFRGLRSALTYSHEPSEARYESQRPLSAWLSLWAKRRHRVCVS